jgi:hypothetical protein
VVPGKRRWAVDPILYFTGLAAFAGTRVEGSETFWTAPP